MTKSKIQTVSTAIMQSLRKPLGYVNNYSQEVYSSVNTQSETVFKRLDKAFPKWPLYVTANRITTARTSLVVPTLFMLSSPSYPTNLAPFSLIIVNLALDYVDGAVARHQRARTQCASEVPSGRLPASGTEDVNSDTHLVMNSRRKDKLEETFGGYFDAVADKTFAIPVWLYLFHVTSTNPGTLVAVGTLQCLLLAHSIIESFSIYIRTKQYFNQSVEITTVATRNNQKTPASEQKGPGNSIMASIAGKTKQALSMGGTALLVLPFPITQVAGFTLLATALPFAAVSLSEKIRARRVYTELLVSSTGFTAADLNHLELCKAKGSELVVGIRCDSQAADFNRNVLEERKMFLSLLHCVDEIVELNHSELVDSYFKRRYDIELVVKR